MTEQQQDGASTDDGHGDGQQQSDHDAGQHDGANTDDGHGDGQQDDAGDTFPRSYVERLRREAADYRTRGQADRDAADALRGELWQARVTAAGRLADPTDLPMPADAEQVDADTVEAAIDALLEAKPHLAARRATGDIGQHAQRGGNDGAAVSLATMLQRGA